MISQLLTKQVMLLVITFFTRTDYLLNMPSSKIAFQENLSISVSGWSFKPLFPWYRKDVQPVKVICSLKPKEGDDEPEEQGKVNYDN